MTASHFQTSIAAMIVGLVGALMTAPVAAEMPPTLSFGGTSGLIDMPSADQQGDGVLSVTSAHFGPISRTTLSFQITPRLSGSFRYTAIRKWDDVLASPLATNYDRSFDLRYQLLQETRLRPAITVGFQDIIGTGLMSGEYIALTKQLGKRLKVTGGLGWGRLGSYGSIGAPFGPRPTADVGLGGRPRLGQWFTGDAAPFAGIEYQLSDKLGLKAEYSSDAYTLESGSRQTFDRKSPFNFGIEYQLNKSIRVGAYYLYGSEFGLSAQLILDPKRRRTGGITGPGPVPVAGRPARGSVAWSQDWVQDSGATTALRDRLQSRLTADGVVIEAITLTGTTAQLRIRNGQLDNGPQAIGRTARAMAAVLPPSVETFEIVPVSNGVAMSRISVQRSDLEQLEFAGGQDALMLQRTEIAAISGALPPGAVMGVGLYPKFTWNLGPYLKTSLFDPSNPLRADFGVRATASYDIAPGLVIAGSISKKLIGNLGSSDRVSNSILPHVRSDANIYDAKGDPSLDSLTLAWYEKPAANLYSRVTLGYLEQMYGGVSTELLWKRVDRPYAIGVEVNYVKQRDFDQFLGFQDYAVFTGHVSGYYSFGNGFEAQLDVGRYLAGDLGATVSIDRTFANGWKVGAFATLTDVPFEDFGEGSFDKGIRIQIPLAWANGRPSRGNYNSLIRPLLRDGGARLNVDGRLYDSVREYHGKRLSEEWGRFWR